MPTIHITKTKYKKKIEDKSFDIINNITIIIVCLSQDHGRLNHHCTDP